MGGLQMAVLALNMPSLARLWSNMANVRPIQMSLYDHKRITLVMGHIPLSVLKVAEMTLS